MFNCATQKIAATLVAIFISIAGLLLSMPITAQEKSAQEKAVHGQFNQVAEQVKELKKRDLALSLKRLNVYQNKLSTLTVEQNLVYFKLLTEIKIEQNSYRAAKNTANKGLSVAKKLVSPSILISELLYLKGFALESLGDIPQATKEYKRGLEVAESLHNKIQIAAGLINLGAIAYLTDDFKRSLVLLNDAYNIAKQTDDEKLKGNANTELGIVYSHLLQDEQSMAYYQQSYLHFKKAGMLLAAHSSLHNIAINHIRNKNYQQAIIVFNTIIAEFTQDTPSESMFNVYLGVAWAHLKKTASNPDAAYRYLLIAKKHLQLTEKYDYQLQYYYNEANILYELGRYDEVLMSIGRVEKIITKYPASTIIKKQRYVRMIKLKAKVFYQQGKYKQAYQTQSSVIALTDKLYENEDSLSVTQVRLKLEAEQADKQGKILQSQKVRYEASLSKANLENKALRIYIIISILIVLSFSWVLIKLMQSQHKLNITSRIDDLTGVANRYSLLSKSEEAFKRAKKNQEQLSVLLIEVGHLQEINDKFGYSIGDTVLAEIASLGANIMRKSDIFGRFGGKVFMVCLPRADMASAIEIAERVRLGVKQHAWTFITIDNDTIEKVSISIGIATLTNDNDLVSLIAKAETQLAQAKTSGKNKVCS
ncbi:tetratricopeptide repeat-containing diguanylate cyclase [Colwellia ponticola]|nr:tetratricopeptide repeat-containing diguanylate cyclase [Colwellia ponticola]